LTGSLSPIPRMITVDADSFVASPLSRCFVQTKSSSSSVPMSSIANMRCCGFLESASFITNRSKCALSSWGREDAHRQMSKFTRARGSAFTSAKHARRCTYTCVSKGGRRCEQSGARCECS